MIVSHNDTVFECPSLNAIYTIIYIAHKTAILSE